MRNSDLLDSSPQLHEAATWFSRLRADDVSDAERASHAAWLSRDPANAAAHQEIERRWRATNLLRDRVLATFDTEASAAARDNSAVRPRRAWRWFPAAATIAGIAASVAILFFSLSESATYTTQTGAQRHLTLSDHSTVAMNTGTELDISITPIRREVLLRHGEAYFDVHSESIRRFVVRTPQVKIRTLGTQFNVLRMPSRTYVTVTEGSVAVTSAADAATRPDGGEVIVRAGERGIFDESGSGQVGPAADRDRIQAWQRGEILFDRTRLADAALELSRYLGVGIRVDAGVADETVSGIFRTDQPQTALAAIERALPVRVRTSNSGQMIVIEAANGQ